ncbi:MAG: 8-oxo-dGTP diphosphatase [Patescibacteria group bacterium]|nr:8-oxo-dGTP diphosphatase [Patescibacteria group bacterium]
MKEKQINTLCIIEEGDEVILAMKKRGFGEGRWNGYGGKPEPEEEIEAAAKRELFEESGVTAMEIKKRGVVEFDFEGTDRLVEVHIFEVTKHEGEPKETEEMRPEKFRKEDISYDEMWPADREWMPYFFKGRDFTGKVIFDAEGKKFLKAEIEEVPKDFWQEKEIPKGNGERLG